MTSTYIPRVDNTNIQHNGTEHLAINNTFLRRLLTRLAIHTTAKFYPRDPGSLVKPLSKNKIVKKGHRIHLTEGATMKFLAENTSIPVPHVYCSFVRKNIAYIVMERIQGEALPIAWKNMSEESLRDVFAQLRKMFEELRDLKPPPGTGVESCVGGSLFDSRISRGNPRFGPFKSIQEFHFWLRQDLKWEDMRDREKDQDWDDVHEMMSQQDGPWPPPCFTHGDLNPANVIVRGNKVVGIIDWEFSGWYPDYWEYTSAWFGNILNTDWQHRLDTILDRPRPEVFKMEQIRNKWWTE